MPRRWTDTDDKVLLLLALKHYSSTKFDYDAIVADWPNANGPVTKHAIEHRLRTLRKQTGVTTTRPAAGRRAPPNTPARPMAAAVATSSTVKSESSAGDPPASASGNSTNKSTPAKATPKTDAKVAAMVIKTEPGTEPSTPTPAAKNVVGTASSGEKRKRNTALSDGTMTDSSEEAISTDNDDTIDSPTAASPKRRRVSQARASKITNASLAHYDGGNSSDENDIGMGAGAGVAWAGVVKKRAKRAQRDDSDSDFDPDFDASNDEDRKGRRSFALRC